MIGMVSSATQFTTASRYDLFITVIFPDFIYSWNRSYKINKTNKLAKKNKFHRELYKGYGSQNFTKTSHWSKHASEKLSSFTSTRQIMYTLN